MKQFSIPSSTWATSWSDHDCYCLFSFPVWADSVIPPYLIYLWGLLRVSNSSVILGISIYPPALPPQPLLIRPLLESVQTKVWFFVLPLTVKDFSLDTTHWRSASWAVTPCHRFHAASLLTRLQLTDDRRKLHVSQTHQGLMTLERFAAFISPTTHCFSTNGGWTLLSHFDFTRQPPSMPEIIQNNDCADLPQLFRPLLSMYHSRLFVSRFIKLDQKGNLFYALLGTASISLACLQQPHSCWSASTSCPFFINGLGRNR